MNAVVEMPNRAPALMAGAQVGAIIPRSIEEMWRVSTMVVQAGLAPSALISNKSGNDAVSAVAVAIMSGAELGMKPMAALRSFTVINGKPALYGDGLINVIRASGKAAYLRTGCEEHDGKLTGWCEAKRSDTGEDKRIEFSQDDAVRAGLWTAAVVTKWNKFKSQNEQKPNDSPWYRYPKRMLAWRAAGYCLRELFADVLGGISDEFEAREVAAHDEPVTISPPSMRPPSLAKPSDPAEEAETVEHTEIVDETREAIEAVQDDEPFDLDAFLSELDVSMAAGKTHDEVIEVWDGYDVEATLTGDDEALQRAFDLRKPHIARVLRAEIASHPVNAG